jgi:long-chain acyl-CoA synthetase
LNTLNDIWAEDEKVLGCARSDILSRLPRRLSHAILQWAESSPEATAIVGHQSALSFQELRSAVSEAIEYLENQGVRPGDRVMIVAENSIALMCLFLAMSEMDAICAVINARLSERELNLIFEDCDPRVMIFTIDDSQDAKAHANRLAGIPAQLSFSKLASTTFRDVDPEPTFDDPAEQVLAMIYTTGTTGTPKGVMLTHQNLSFIAFISGQLRGIRPGDGVYGVLPMSHVFGLSAVSSAVLFGGGCIHLVARFDPEKAIQTIVEKGLVGFLGVPTMFALMLEKLKDIADWKPGELRFMYSGGAPLDPDLKFRVQEKFGLPLHNGYGLTETGPTISQTRLYLPLDNCSVGYPLPGEEIKILGSHGELMPAGEVGELWVKGPNVMKGYFRKPTQTAQVIKDGWFNTEDLVCVDETGAIHIAGRSKELIIRSGFNVYPPEVEAVISSHPSVSLCAVLGEKAGTDEIVVAYVQLAEGKSTTEAALISYARESLSGYKVPSRVQIMDLLPTAPSGKILKHQLRSQ